MLSVNLNNTWYISIFRFRTAGPLAFRYHSWLAWMYFLGESSWDMLRLCWPLPVVLSEYFAHWFWRFRSWEYADGSCPSPDQRSFKVFVARLPAQVRGKVARVCGKKIWFLNLCITSLSKEVWLTNFQVAEKLAMLSCHTIMSTTASPVNHVIK